MAPTPSRRWRRWRSWWPADSGSPDVARTLRGIGVSPGVAVAPALIIRWDFPEVPDRGVRAEQVDAEVRRLREAVDHTVAALQELGERVLRRAGPEEARIFEAQILMAQ